jgi:hypothetical protein
MIGFDFDGVVTTGIYKPVSNELTPARISKINKLYSKFKTELTDKNIEFIKYPSHTSPIKMKKRAEALRIKATSKGLFIAKEGHRKGSIEFDRNRGEYRIKLTGKIRQGKRTGQRISTYVPLSSIDQFEKELDRLENQSKTLIPLKSNERLRFRVVEANNDGFSNSVFSEWSLAKEYLSKYEIKPLPSRLGFFRHLVVEKVSYQNHLNDLKFKRAQNKKRRVNSKGRN